MSTNTTNPMVAVTGMLFLLPLHDAEDVEPDFGEQKNQVHHRHSEYDFDAE